MHTAMIKKANPMAFEITSETFVRKHRDGKVWNKLTKLNYFDAKRIWFYAFQTFQHCSINSRLIFQSSHVRVATTLEMRKQTR